MLQSIKEPQEDGFWRLSKVSVDSNERDFWDDGFGPVWAYLETMGIVGFVRAETWEKAWECLVDEIMPDALPFEEWDTDEQEAFKKDGTLPEGCHFRGGQPSNRKLKESIAQEDLNGSALERVTPSFATRHNIKIYWDNE